MKLLLLCSLLLLISCKPNAAPSESQLRSRGEIESPVQNTCQSSDLLAGFPRCPE